MDKVKDRIRGCLIGGAAGDALGYEVEFIKHSNIIARFGEKGITSYEYDADIGRALISDDTQMTMFTAEGVLHSRATGKSLVSCVARAYSDWLQTQQLGFRSSFRKLGVSGDSCLLMKLPQLYSCRAPGNTCLSALMMRNDMPISGEDYISNPVNESKGCGGVMRAAPVGMLKDAAPETLAYTAAQIAAITHSHPMGYMPAAVLAYIVNRLVYAEGDIALIEAVEGAKCMVDKVFDGNGFVYEMIEWLDDAIELSNNDDSDINNIARLGEGWVGDEALAIALYCCLRHENDFSAAIIAAVNHGGDSDSTGAIAGNILGALHGYEAIDDKWKQGLELSETILELADELAAEDGDERLGKYSIN